MGAIKMRPEVVWFSSQMEKVLRAHDDKGGWNKKTALNLFLNLKGEEDELYNQIYIKRKNRDRKQIIRECVDLANYAMMIADNINNKRDD